MADSNNDTPFTRYNRLSNLLYNRFDNRFDNRLYRVNGASVSQVIVHYSTYSTTIVRLV